MLIDERMFVPKICWSAFMTPIEKNSILSFLLDNSEYFLSKNAPESYCHLSQHFYSQETIILMVFQVVLYFSLSLSQPSRPSSPPYLSFRAPLKQSW